MASNNGGHDDEHSGGRHSDRVSPSNPMIHKKYDPVVREGDTPDAIRTAIYMLGWGDFVCTGYSWKGGIEYFWTRVEEAINADQSDINQLEKAIFKVEVLGRSKNVGINQGRMLYVGFWNITAIVTKNDGAYELIELLTGRRGLAPREVMRQCRIDMES